MFRRTLIAFLIAFVIPPVAAQSLRTLPFTEEENHDGAKFVWFIFGQSGFPYNYTPAANFPPEKFGEVMAPQSGDVAWWPSFMCVYNNTKNICINAGQHPAMDELEIQFGKPKYFRYIK